jgi:hypothetical protein
MKLESGPKLRVAMGALFNEKISDELPARGPRCSGWPENTSAVSNAFTYRSAFEAPNQDRPQTLPPRRDPIVDRVDDRNG